MPGESDRLVPAELLRHVPNWGALVDKGYRWLEYQVNMCDVAQTLAVADLLWPPLIEVEDCIFLNVGAGLGQSVQSLRDLYGSDRDVERWFNMHRLIELVATTTESQVLLAEDDALLSAFGDVLRNLWSLRLATVFPERTFNIEVGDDIGEEGLAITFSQRKS